MPRKFFAVMAGLMVFGMAFPAAWALRAKGLVGAYELQGVRETAGFLMLHPDQKYLAEFSYGAADWQEEGAWKLEGDEVVFSGARFKVKNYDKIPFFLPEGLRLKVRKGDLTSQDPKRSFTFINSR